MKIKKLVTLTAIAVLTENVYGQTENLLQGWDGTGCAISEPIPSHFGWTSSENREFKKENNSGGIRFTTKYTGYKLSNGTSYTYSAHSDPSSKIFWIRYNKSGESFTYTTNSYKLQAGHTYKYSALVGWHNNNDYDPTVTSKIKAGDKELATVSQYIKGKQTLYLIEKTFYVSDDVNETSFSVSFTCNRTGDCLIALSALSIVEVAPKQGLQDIVADLTAKVPTANFGYGAFQYPKLTIDNIKTALQTAQEVCDKIDATDKEVKDQLDIVGQLTIPALNGPEENVRYKICVTADDFFKTVNKEEKLFSVKNHPITFKAGGQGDGIKDKTDKNYDGYYSLTYEFESDKNYGQAFQFIPVEGENDMYKISFTGVDGETCYMATQKGAGYQDAKDVARIRVTEDIDKALKFRVVATSEEGEWNLLNTESPYHTPIGVDDYGVYTRTNRPGFNIAPAEQAEAKLKIVSDVKYGTFIAPFNPVKPDNVTLYSVDEVNESTLILKEADEIAANTPYIVYADEEVTDTLQGYGTAYKDIYEAGLLVGTLPGGEMTTLGADCYLLQKNKDQNNNDVVGFYQCEEGKTYTLGANRAYLQYPTQAGVKAFFFGEENQTTAITTLSELMNGKAEIYDLNGRKLRKLEKGINIVNGKKVIIK